MSEMLSRQPEFYDGASLANALSWLPREFESFVSNHRGLGLPAPQRVPALMLHLFGSLSVASLSHIANDISFNSVLSSVSNLPITSVCIDP